MKAARIIPDNETERLAALRRYDILDTPPDGTFDDVTRIAAALFRVPIAIVSLVDEDRIWFKSAHGLDVAQIDRVPGLCASAILGDEAWILTEAHVDPRSLSNPLVAGAFGLRFYAGVPLKTRDGFNLGSLCVIDRAPRQVTPEEIALLEGLAAMVMEHMELRLSARRAVDRMAIVQREVDHRLISNLQSLSMMLEAQADAVGTGANPDPACEHLREGAHRMMAMAAVHRAFLTADADGHIASSGDRVAGLSYLRRLCADLAKMLGRSIEVRGDEVMLQPMQAQSIGLVVHELVANALKHGGTVAEVRIGAKGETRIELSVADNGPGLPIYFDPETSEGIGLSVIMAMVEQIDGTIEFGATKYGGARISVEFAAD